MDSTPHTTMQEKHSQDRQDKPRRLLDLRFGHREGPKWCWWGCQLCTVWCKLSLQVVRTNKKHMLWCFVVCVRAAHTGAFGWPLLLC